MQSRKPSVEAAYRRLEAARDRDRRLYDNSKRLARDPQSFDPADAQQLVDDIRSVMAERSNAVAESRTDKARAAANWQAHDLALEHIRRLLAAGDRLYPIANANGGTNPARAWRKAADAAAVKPPPDPRTRQAPRPADGIR